MSIEISNKLKAIRESEGLSQAKFADLIGIAVGTVKQYETGIRGVGTEVLLKVTMHPQLKKYTTWLMSDETNEAAGQISPSLSPNGCDVTFRSQSPRKTGTRHD
ncbi:XRE family transcriptional regulator [Salmonella enterica subsp. enterica serovar Uzaramo]|uniref:helix-turn-helix transcriptional regulator n=1 Tax=Salmonella enterica TaxID=28901 RepID=UPI000DFE3C3F|nr:helix-turn-helix transcriptional regulator [Salmonella enterica]EAB9200770.1 XRE family transcriptional regulator [Salmonella enterica subsp. enterica serovar Neukoelln]EAC0951465.1 helix-turn-helix domain-containing protein [Salmonella enterica subsp. enterica]EBZ9039881.1 XRE family transcriptional regulator [Salmonella enterica subsp. enterica serovar Uzaramo]EBR9122910.1 XRE family transcriptional regulator [Salmonella enterica subsp. enterica serovar Neukoelln]EBR9278021.1 helix-turn-h